MAVSSGPTAVSPSPRTIASTLPSACASTSPAMNETLWPPKKTKQPGTACFAAAASSIASGVLAR
jgi:hypothetical protein